MTEVLQSTGVEPPLEKGSPVHTRRGMTLEVDKVARLLPLIARIRGAEEVVEAHLQQRGLRRIRGDMPADARIVLVLLVHHRHRVPANQRLDAALQRAVAWIRSLIVLGDGVLERSDHVTRRWYTGLARTSAQCRQQRSA